MSHEDLRCRDAVELVTDYLEGALAGEDRATLERHLAWCDWCATYFDQMRETIRLAGSLREEDIPAPVMDSFVAAYRELHAR